MAFEILSVAWTRAGRPSRRSQLEIDRCASRCERPAGGGPREAAPLEVLKDHLRDGLTLGIEGGDVPVLFDEELGAADVIDLGMRMLEVFVEKVVLPGEVLGVEVPFSMDLGHPITGEILPVPVVGAIDALVVEEGNTTVLELKTAKRRWAPDQLEYDLQMSGYKMAARTLGHGEVVSAA